MRGVWCDGRTREQWSPHKGVEHEFVGAESAELGVCICLYSGRGPGVEKAMERSV